MEWASGALNILSNIFWPNNNDPAKYFQMDPPIHQAGNQQIFKEPAEPIQHLEQCNPQSSIEKSSNESQYQIPVQPYSIIEINDVEDEPEAKLPNPFLHFDSHSSGEVQEVKIVKKRKKSSSKNSKNKKNSRKTKKHTRKKTEIVEEGSTDEKMNAKTVDEDVADVKITPNKKRTRPDEEYEFSPKLKVQKVSEEAVSPSNHIQLPTILLENWAISSDSLQIDERSFLGGGSFGLVKKGLVRSLPSIFLSFSPSLSHFPFSASPSSLSRFSFLSLLISSLPFSPSFSLRLPY